MYDFAFIKVVNNGESETEIFESANGAHVAMGIYAGKHDLNTSVHDERWRTDSKSVVYEGNNPMFNTMGYVVQMNDVTASPESRKKTKKTKKNITA